MKFIKNEKEKLMTDFDIEYHFEKLKMYLWDKGYKVRLLKISKVCNSEEVVIEV
jgi:hypothetical protein